jgi:hypothetical protein
MNHRVLTRGRVVEINRVNNVAVTINEDRLQIHIDAGATNAIPRKGNAI